MALLKKAVGRVAFLLRHGHLHELQSWMKGYQKCIKPVPVKLIILHWYKKSLSGVATCYVNSIYLQLNKIKTLDKKKCFSSHIIFHMSKNHDKNNYQYISVTSQAQE